MRPLRVVVDCLPVNGMSLGILVQHLVTAWSQLGCDDELHLVVGPDAALEVPDAVTVHEMAGGGAGYAARVANQTLALPRVCRRIGADVLLGVLPTTTMSPLPCPRVVMVYDLRHELRPRQFSRTARLLRTVSYDVGFWQADGLACISERTRRDLLRLHPRAATRPVRVVHLGSDHVDDWRGGPARDEYALAFGQYGNKNVDLVLDAWATLEAAGSALPLVVMGLSDGSRQAVETKARQMGLSELVTVLPWLPDQSFREWFASASLVVFPSDFEGFGLPAVEAMRLGIGLVVAPDPALLEVTAGHATVMDGYSPGALAAAVRTARSTPRHELAAARAHAEGFTWANTARRVRELLIEVSAGGR